MIVADLEQGSVYEGRSGQRREVVKMTSGWLTYRMIFRGFRVTGKSMQVGQLGSVRRGEFAKWAVREVSA